MPQYIEPQSRNGLLGVIADALSSAKSHTGLLGDVLLGGAPEMLDRASYGQSPVTFGGTGNGLMGAINGMHVDPGIVDAVSAASLLGPAARLGSFAGREGLRAVDDAMQSGSGLLGRALSSVAPLHIGSPVSFDPVLMRGMNIADAKATESTLPAVADGMTRLYRGSSPDVHFDDVFNASGLSDLKPTKEGVHFTPDMNYADYYRQSYGKNAKLSYIDVPTQDLPSYEGAGGAYIIPIVPSN